MQYEDYLPLIYKTIKETGIYKFEDWEDCVQDGGLVFLETLQDDYDNFGAYFKQKLRWYYFNKVRKHISDLNITTLDFVKDDSTFKLADTIASDIDIEKSFFDFQQIRMLDEELDCNIIYIMIKQGFTQNEIGEFLGISQATVSRRVKDIKEECDRILGR